MESDAAAHIGLHRADRRRIGPHGEHVPATIAFRSRNDVNVHVGDCGREFDTTNAGQYGRKADVHG